MSTTAVQPVLSVTDAQKPGILKGLRVVEVADELGAYCGMMLAGMGAEVIKIEPPTGCPTRSIGPFYGNKADPEKSLFFWNYNRGKRSVVLDLESDSGKADLLKLLDGADILLDTTSGLLNSQLRLRRDDILKNFPGLILARVTPFGDTGPWKDFRGSDLVHLALGGVMMNCGYDADPKGEYDLPPIAPQLWHAYHITGEQLMIGIVAALIHHERTGEGQEVVCAVHECVAKNTELDIMNWVMRCVRLFRQTCRHAAETPGRVPVISHTKDGRWIMNWGVSPRDLSLLIPFLSKYDMQADLLPPDTGADLWARAVPGSAAVSEQTSHKLEVIQRFVRAHTYENIPWREAQDAGLLWAPLRKPHENILDEHWQTRATFTAIDHPELGRSFVYPTSKWLSDKTDWQIGRRAPLLGEDTQQVLAEASAWRRRQPTVPAASKPPKLSALSKPFPLQDVRIFDFSWFLASAGGTRYLAGLGAECLKVEWKDNPDTKIAAMAPVGGRAAREAATGPIPGVTDPDMGGHYHHKNAGKMGLSLNVRHPDGLKIAKQLIAISDVVAEGFSPGVLDRMGLGYAALKEVKPDIIYVQQSGMGSMGTYGRFRTLGPVAAAFAGQSDMSGLPEPAMPAGWGYSFLDWMGAYGFALAITAGLYHRDRTGEGQYIDSSQVESGLFLNGVPILDWSANDRPWSRLGNRSPYKPAAPHGAYRCSGDDRWLAVACFSDADWSALLAVSGLQHLADDARFATLEARLRNQDALDAEISKWTLRHDGFELMARLQAARVPAGMCQTAEDRIDADPQLDALSWMTELEGKKVGVWPVPELPMKLSATPAYVGGPINRGAPIYGEHNDYVLGELLGYSRRDIQAFADAGVI